MAHGPAVRQSSSGRSERADPVGRRGATTTSIGFDTAIAEPRRADARRPRSGRRPDRRRRHAAAARDAAGSDDQEPRALHAGRALRRSAGALKGWTRLWSTKTCKPRRPLLAGHTGEVLAASTSPDGEHARHRRRGRHHPPVRPADPAADRRAAARRAQPPGRAEFTPDGAYLFAITNAGRAYRWDVRPSTWERHACAVAGRTLTRAEWNDALPGRDYHPACAG